MRKERNNKLLKILDRYIGIPIVFLLGILKQKKQIPTRIDKIGILATAAIGDTIIMSGAINSIKKKYPTSKIILFCGSSNYEVAKLLNNIDKVKKLQIKNVIKSKKIIQENEFDVWIDFGPWPRLNSILTSFAKASYKIGFNTKGQYRHFIYDKWVLHNDFMHEHENYCELLKLINIIEFEKPNLLLENGYENNFEKYVVLHLFAGGSKADLKHLPLEVWQEVSQYIIEQGYQVFVTGAPSDSNRLNKFIKMSKLDIVNMSGKLSLKQTAQLLTNSKLVISIDTGIMHLASALDCDLIAVYGPTDPKRWGPLSDKSHCVYLNKKCAPCISLGFESNCINNICMADINSSDIVKVIEKGNLL